MFNPACARPIQLCPAPSAVELVAIPIPSAPPSPHPLNYPPVAESAPSAESIPWEGKEQRDSSAGVCSHTVGCKPGRAQTHNKSASVSRVHSFATVGRCAVLRSTAWRATVPYCTTSAFPLELPTQKRDSEDLLENVSRSDSTYCTDLTAHTGGVVLV